MHDYDTLANWLREQAAAADLHATTMLSERQRGYDQGMAAAYRIMLAKIESNPAPSAEKESTDHGIAK